MRLHYSYATRQKIIIGNYISKNSRSFPFLSNERRNSKVAQSKVIFSKVPVDLNNRFSLLAEYLFERGLSERFTPSVLLRDTIEHLLSEYHPGLLAYGNARSLNDASS